MKLDIPEIPDNGISIKDGIISIPISYFNKPMSEEQKGHMALHDALEKDWIEMRNTMFYAKVYATFIELYSYLVLYKIENNL